MNLNKTLFALLILSATMATAQVKIGENPNNIDAASIIELESTTKAFVLTRVSEVQMQSISPLYGAMVYNTDTQCIHYFDGTQWNNLCNNASSGNSSVVDNGNGTFTFSNGIGGPVTFYGSPESVSTLVNNFDGTYTYTNENGITTQVTSNLTQTDIEAMGFVTGAHTIDTDTNLTETEVDAFVANNGYSTGAHTIDTNTQLTNAEVAAAATAEGFVTGAHTVDTDTHADQTEIEGMGFVTGAHTVETNTSLSQNTTTGVITYTNEASSPQTANVVSSDANNSIKIGLDGGAYFGAYEKIVIWAEENSSLANNQLEWSFGNGATGLIGIPLPEAWEAYAVSFNADVNGATDTVLMAVIDSNTNTNLFTFTATGNANNMVYTQILATPVAIPAGTSIGFRTVTEVGNVSDARVAVFLRRRP